MKQWIAILAIMLVALTPTVYAVGQGAGQDAGEQREQIREQARENIQEAVQIRTEAREQAREQRMNVAEIGESLKACKGKKTADCDDKRKDAKVKAKDVLVKATEDVTALLTSTKEKIMASDVADKEALAADLDAQIAKIAEAKTKVDALTGDSTKKEINDAAKELRKAVQEAKVSLKKGANKLVASKLGGVLVITEQLQAKLESRLKQLEEKGADVSSVAFDAFKAKIAEAKSLHAEAATSLEQAKNAAEAEKEQYMKQATEKLRESHGALNQARTMLKEMLQKIQQLEIRTRAENRERIGSTEQANTSATPPEATTDNTTVETPTTDNTTVVEDNTTVVETNASA